MNAQESETVNPDSTPAAGIRLRTIEHRFKAMAFEGMEHCGYRVAGLPRRWALLDTINAWRYYKRVILSFACAETERVFRAELSRRFPPDIQRSARRKLLALHAATELRHLVVPPGNRLETLKGGVGGQHSIRVNDQWRICFCWREGNAYGVEIVDNH